ncbi:S-adenosylmethionine:diacylglycerol 3-amino-3-carboxypropyl transferase [Rhodovulum sp. PH10]|uniref:DUF3419 family protein n=1 Tax=Rhodovulum sp. PH10 TaxID=1187851 RepID=UPI00027C2A70|nr:DUF3419 family protein [Rhodovulum sp. PH10]EJW11126.1 S-adenosylmethionine:diacylglycerol 3-amino-3-carboxypropyl transferase [Rhodovulum sp. PH10]
MNTLSKTPCRVSAAVRRTPALSRQGLSEILFAWMFRGLVYPQIWEDPAVDMAALEIGPDHHVVAIASGGCNVLSYLTADPKRITAVDVNTAHVALVRLKLAAVRHLPSWNAFYRFFGEADSPANVLAYWRHLAPVLDDATRAYWEGRSAFGLGRRRISIFARNVYRHGLLGHFIGLGHAVARAYGVDPKKVLAARSREEQLEVFETMLAPLFDKRFVRWAVSRPVALYGLGIPPAQYVALASAGTDMASVLRRRVEKLTCDFDLDDNYFAWQAFGRRYGDGERGPVPPYLARDNYALVHERAERVGVVNASMTDHLATLPAGSVDRYVLLDAQDWMSDATLGALWNEITRTARPGARVVFRTAAAPSILPGRLDPSVLSRWRYEQERSETLGARDRSAIYGGFHLYVLTDGTSGDVAERAR